MTTISTSKIRIETIATRTIEKKKQTLYIHLKNFVSKADQKQLAQCVLRCHTNSTATVSENDDDEGDCCFEPLKTASSSMKLDLGLLYCGSDMSECCPLAVSLARCAFREASKIQYLKDGDNNNHGFLKQFLSQQEDTTNDTNGTTAMMLTGIALLYGPNGKMPPHYDSPTQKLNIIKEEWLVMLNVGNTLLFRCNDEVLSVASGDAVVMDAMNVFHGVEGIEPPPENNCDVALLNDLPAGSRLGVLLWHGQERVKQAHSKTDDEKTNIEVDIIPHGLDDLFATSDDDY